MTLQQTLSERDIVNYLPDKQMTLMNIAAIKVLGQSGEKRLGDFEVLYAYDPKSMDALSK